MNYSHITPEASMVMKMASGDNPPPPSGRVPGRALEPPRDGFDDGGGVGVLCGNWLSVRGIFRFGGYMGERARSVAPQEAHTYPRRGPGVGRAGSRLRLILGPLLRHGKNRNIGFCHVQFREYFLYNFSETKNSRKQELALWHLVNRLVPENA